MFKTCQLYQVCATISKQQFRYCAQDRKRLHVLLNLLGFCAVTGGTKSSRLLREMRDTWVKRVNSFGYAPPTGSRNRMRIRSARTDPTVRLQGTLSQLGEDVQLGHI